MLKGVFDKRRLLDLLQGFHRLWRHRQTALAKILAGYHQFHAVRHAVARTLAATAPTEIARSASSGTPKAPARAC